MRIGFYFVSDWFSTVAVGWYIDDVCIESGPETFPDLEDFEAGIGDWSADNGLWQVGTPTAGPASAYSGQNCVGTILGGNYPSNANTRLISPQIVLPSSHVRIKFWQWFGMNDGDWGLVQVSTDNGITWQTVSRPDFDGNSSVWTQGSVDVSAYAGSTVRIGFYFFSDGFSTIAVGWYIDDIRIAVGSETFRNPEDFAAGIGDWSSDNGLWEVGAPTAGPPSAHSGQNCAGTVLGGNYPSNANTRLISPQITLTPLPGHELDLFFYHWYVMNDGDQGKVEISVNDGMWQSIPGFGGPYTGSSTGWPQGYVPLSAYRDSTVRIGFNFTSDGFSTVSVGWYIDDVRIEGIESAGIGQNWVSLPAEFEIQSVFPNPFNSTTTIQISIPHRSPVALQVYDLLGRRVVDLTGSSFEAGKYTLQWNADGFASGTYWLVLTTPEFKSARKVVLLK